MSFTLPSNVLAGRHSIQVSNINGLSNIFWFTVTASNQFQISVSINKTTKTEFNEGETGALLGSFNISANSSAVNNLNGIQIGSSFGNLTKYLSNVKVVISGLSQPISVDSFAFDRSVWISPKGLVIPANGSVEVNVYADIKNDVGGVNFNMGISGLNFSGAGSTSSGLPVFTDTLAVKSSFYASPSIKNVVLEKNVL